MKKYKSLMECFYIQLDEECDIQSWQEFLEFTRVCSPDDGGIVEVIVDGYVTNIYVGDGWMLKKKSEDQVSYSFDELTQLSQTKKVEINWANK